MSLENNNREVLINGIDYMELESVGSCIDTDGIVYPMNVDETIDTNCGVDWLDTSDEWIRTRTGIEKRHTVKDSKQGPADLAAIAAEKLIAKQNINKEDIDFVVFATSTPDRFVPGSGSMFQDKLGLKNIGASLGIVMGC